jgi:broad specificity phosphatase PhoE
MITRVTSALDGIAAAHPGGRVLAVAHAGVLCAAWLASGGRLADWQGTYNGDLQEVAVNGDGIRWVGLAHRAEERGQSEPSLFWRV